MSTTLLLGSIAIITLGLVVTVRGLYMATRASNDVQERLAAELRGVARDLSEVVRRTDGLARHLDHVARTVRPPPDAAVLASEIASQLAIQGASAVPSRPGAPLEPKRVEPLEVLVGWWNRVRVRAAQVREALPMLHHELQGFNVEQVEMVKGLVGLRFDPPLPGGFQEVVVLPELTLAYGDLKAVFEAPSGTPDLARIDRLVRPASIDKRYHRESRSELANYGLAKGRIEPGALL